MKEDSSLKFHLQNAKDHGVTQKEIAAVITHVGFYAGWPKAWAVEVPGEEISNEWCEAVSDEEYGKLNKKCDKMVAVRELIAAIFLVSPCVRKELPVAGHVDTKVCKRSCWRTILRINRDRT